MDYRLHHIGLVCRDVEKNMDIYLRMLGNQLTTRWFDRESLDIAFLGNGSDGLIELVGEPFMDYEQEHIDHHGYSINHLSFLVEDADAAFECLRKQGVQVAWEPKNYINVRQCGFYDPDRVLLEVFSYLPDMFPFSRPVSDKQGGPHDLRLHHISILTPDLRRSQRFYTEKMGFSTVYEYLEDDGGFIFMVDPFFDFYEHDFMLEIIGPPYLEPREVAFLEKRGACLDHLCYVAGDVRGAWQAAVERGAPAIEEPVWEEKYGLCISWVKDADGNDIEILSPLPREEIEEAIRSGQPFDAVSAYGSNQ